MILLKCQACSSTDVVGPFEMDGMVRGEYRTTGLWWIVCRGCGVSTLAHEQTAMFDEPAAPPAARAKVLAQASLFGSE